MRRLLAPPLLLLALARCSGDLPPFESVPAALDKNQQAAIASGDGTVPTTVGICYNSFTTDAAQVRAVAAQACGAGTVPHAVQRDFQLANCPMLEPARLTFACLPKAP